MVLKQLNMGWLSRFCLSTCLFLMATVVTSVVTDGTGFGVSEVVAAEKKKKQTKAEKEASLKYKNAVSQRRKSVGTSCAKKLTKVQEFTEVEDWVGAEAELLGAFKRGCSEGFEYSQVNRYLGYVYYAQDKIQLSIKAYLALVNEPEADPQQRTNTRYTVAQLLFVNDDYKRAVEQLELWMAEAAIVDPGGKILLARGYYQLDRKSEALNLVEEVVEEAIVAGLVPKENWLNFQWALYYEKDNYKATIKVSNRLLTHYPKIKYWKQLSAMYGALEQSQKELMALEVTYLQNGLDKEKQLIALAYQYLAIDIPYRAAQVLEKGMKDEIIERKEKNLALLGSSYQRAQEYLKASPVLEEAAKKSSDGNAWSRLAGVYLNLNENEKALLAARNAIKKGKLKRADLAWMSRGTAEQALHCYKDAEKSFTKAAKFKKTEKGARSWKRYVTAEGDRRRKLVANGAKLATCKKV